MKGKVSRKSAADLVKKSVVRSVVQTWYDALHAEDKSYVLSVVKAMRSEPNCHVYKVAEMLIEELGLIVKTRSVVIKLKELLKNG